LRRIVLSSLSCDPALINATPRCLLHSPFFFRCPLPPNYSLRVYRRTEPCNSWAPPHLPALFLFGGLLAISSRRSCGTGCFYPFPLAIEGYLASILQLMTPSYSPAAMASLRKDARLVCRIPLPCIETYLPFSLRCTLGPINFEI